MHAPRRLAGAGIPGRAGIRYHLPRANRNELLRFALPSMKISHAFLLRAAFGALPFAFAPGCESGLPARAAGAETPLDSAGWYATRSVDYDVEHYRIEIALHPAARRLEGMCRVRLYPVGASLSAVDLDFVGMAATAVRDETGRDLDFDHREGILTIHLAEPLVEGEYTELSVAYGGRPVTGLWFSGRRQGSDEPTQVFTQGQADHNRGWFPCVGDPSDRATSEVIVTMPDGWRSMAAGERIDVQRGTGTVTEHWRMNTPHPSYLVTLVAGEFLVREDEWNGVPLYFVAEPRYADMLDATFHETDEVLSFLADYTACPYPYPKYSQAIVANFPWGGMENISATTLTPLTLNDERGTRDEESHRLVAHEASHQWFGDLLTCRDWSQLWLHEGFATYMTLLYFEHSRGPDEFRARLREAQLRYLDADRTDGREATVNAVFREPEDLLDAHRYEGAAIRLHLLRSALGDDVFRSGVRAFVAENAGGSVDTDDLRRVMERVSGRDLGWFFAQWIHGTGHPELEVDWSWNERREVVVLEVRQLQAARDGTPAAFRFPVDVVVHDTEGLRVHRIEVVQRRSTFELPAAARPQYVRLDEFGAVPKVLVRDRPAAEWIAIAGSDRDVNARRDAVLALGRLARQARTAENLAAHEAYVSVIVRRLRTDPSPYVRADAAQGLGLSGGIEARARLLAAAGEDESARVRAAALYSLRAWGPNPEHGEFGRRMFDTGYSWATMGAAAGLVCTADPDGAYAWLTGVLATDSPHDQLLARLLDHLGSLPDPAVSGDLLAWARDDAVHPTARAAALRQLPRQDSHRISNARAVVAFLGEENFRLRLAAVEVLAEFGDATSLRALKDHYPRAVTARERRAIEASLRERP